MNIIPIILDRTKFNLSQKQQEQCGERCLAYISSTNVQVTTCGTRIEVDNVFPQKEPISLISYPVSGITEVHASIDGHPAIAIASTALLEKQHIFDFCTSQKINRLGLRKEYDQCKHIKLLIDSKDIIIAK